MEWTKEQNEAIKKDGTNIIVSAGAGSGKTAVLTARVVEKLKRGINIDELLILTFTKAAAKEMKDRIKSSIEENPELKNQLSLLDKAYITTFDSFSYSILKKYHYKLNLSKNILVDGNNVLTLKKIEILDQIFEELYNLEDQKFIKFIYDFCTKDDNNIKSQLLAISNKIELKYDKKKYLKEYIENNFNEQKISKDIKEYEKIIIKKVNTINDLLEKLKIYTEEEYIYRLKDNLSPILNKTSYEDFKNSKNIKLDTVPRGSNDETKKLKEKIKKTVDEISLLCPYKDIDEIKTGIYKTKEYIEVIISILLKLDEKLEKYKNENELYNFNDIARISIDLLKNNLDIKEEIKNSFKEIMIDEYQDTSDIQEEFISLISNNNVYMVGDVKQSIYRFRNANPYIFKKKYDNYKNNIGGYKIDLNKNFRSRDEVLFNINEIFDLIMDDYIGGAVYRKEHRMIFGNNLYNKNKPNEDKNIEIYNYLLEDKKFTKEEVEAFIVAHDIKEKIENKYKVMNKKTGELYDCTYSDFVILIDKATSFPLYKKIFEYLNIPLAIYRDENLIDDINITLIKNIIEIAILNKNKEYNERFKYLYMSIARSYLFKLDDNTLFKSIKNNNYNLDYINKITDVLDQNISYIIEKIIQVFCIESKLIKIGDVSNHEVVLDYLLDASKNLEMLGYSINDFKTYLDLLIKNKIDLKFSLNKDTKNSVKIMTIHGSKGLEFPICYYTSLHNKFNIKELNEKILYQNNIVIPYLEDGFHNTIYKEILKDEYIKEEISEKIRLFYVALTRAKEKMIIVSSLKDEAYFETDGIVDDRLSVRSFLDILNLVREKLEKYVVNYDISKIDINKKYNFKRKIEVQKENTSKINLEDININTSLQIKQKLSKENNNLITRKEKELLKLGTDIHYILENLDFKKPDFSNIDEFYKNKINSFLNSSIFLDNNYIRTYKEFEFEYGEEVKYHGVIDLIIEYETYIKIVDYKLKNISDDAYIEQLKGYKKYIENLTKKPAKIYLYSILDEIVSEI